MEIRIVDAKGERLIPLSEVKEHAATETCRQHGWDVHSAAWRDLATTPFADIVLLEHAKAMFPDAQLVELVEGA